MGRKCSYLYLDQNGKPSAHYYDLVAKHGHTAALENYLHYMVEIADTRFSKIAENSLDKILEADRKIKAAQRDGTLDRSQFISMSKILGENSEINKEAMYIAGAVNIKAKEIAASNPSMLVSTAKDKAREYFGYNPETGEYTDPNDALSAYKALTKKMYEAHATQGSAVHRLIEAGLNARKKRYDKFHSTEGAKVTDPEFNYTLSNINSFKKEAVEEFEKAVKAGEVEPLTKNILDHADTILAIVLTQIEALEKEYGPLEVMSELNIVGENVTYGNKKVYGISDIYLHSKSKNIGIVIDLKTKSSDSILNFNSPYADLMKGKFSSMPDNPSGHVQVQTSGYASVLSNDYGVDVVKTVAIAIPFRVALNEESDGSKKFMFTSLDSKNDKTGKSKVIIEENTPLVGPIEDAFDIKTDAEGVPKGTLETDLSELFGGKLNSKVDNSRQIQIQEARIKKTADGKYRWWNPFEKRAIKKNTKEELKKHIKFVHNQFEQEKKNGRVDLVRLFKEGRAHKKSIWARGKFRQKAAFILEGMTPDTYEVYTRDNLKELSDVGDDIIIFRNKLTSEITVVSVSNLYNSRYSFEKEGETDARTSILGNIITDDTVKAKYGNIVPKADTHNMQLAKLALIASRLKRLNPKKFGKVASLQSVTSMGSFDNFKTSSMGAQIGVLNTIADALTENEMPLPQDLELLVSNKELVTAEEYNDDPFNTLMQLVKNFKDPLMGVGGDAAYAQRQLRNRINQLEKDGISLDSDYILEKRLNDYLKQIHLSVAAKKKISVNEVSAIASDAGYMLANNAVLALRGMLVKSAPTFQGGMLGDFNSIKTINDPWIEAAAKNIELHEQRARDELTEFMSEHNVKLQNLMNAVGISAVDKANKRDVHREVFADMLEDGFEFDPANPDRWMRFKDPDDPTLVHEEQREYIRFYNKMVKKAAKLLHSSGEFEYMYPETETEESSWKVGQIPIIKKINSQSIKEAVTDPKGYAKRMVDKAVKPSEKERNERIEAPWEFDVTYMKQVDMNPGRGSAYTRDLMGISDEGEAIPGDKNIETNPVTVLNMMMLTGKRKEHMEQAAIVAGALDASLANASTVFKDAGVDVKPLRDVMSRFNQMLIHGRYKDEKVFGKVFDTAGKAVSTGLFFASWRQFVTETATATSQITSGTMSGLFSDVLFGQDANKKFSENDIAWATTQTMSPFGEQILLDYGWYNSDLGHFIGDEYNETRKKFIWSTKWGTAPIHTVLKQSTQMLVLAQMHKEGVTKDCYTLDKDKGRWIYDETKDKRFYVYEEGLGFGESKPPTSKNDIARWEYWKAHRAEMKKENSLRDGKMTRPFTVRHLNSIKHYAIRLVGSMDSKQLLAVEYVAMGRAATKFKRWMRQKFDNIYSPTYASEKEGIWAPKEDAMGNVIGYDFIKQDFEGYIQSVSGMLRELKNTGWSWSEAHSKMSTRRKENLSKILSDLILWLLMTWAVTELLAGPSEEEKKMMKAMGMETKINPLSEDLQKGVRNAIADIMPVTAAYNLISGSPSATASIIATTAKTSTTSLAYFISGDFDKAKQYATRSLETFGSVRTGEGLADIINN